MSQTGIKACLSDQHVLGLKNQHAMSKVKSSDAVAFCIFLLKQVRQYVLVKVHGPGAALDIGDAEGPSTMSHPSNV